MSKKRIPKIGDFVIVHWIDAHGIADWVEEKDILEKATLVDVFTVGWIIHLTDDKIVTCATFNMDKQVSDLCVVPRTWVTTIHFLPDIQKLKEGK